MLLLPSHSRCAQLRDSGSSFALCSLYLMLHYGLHLPFFSVRFKEIHLWVERDSSMCYISSNYLGITKGPPLFVMTHLLLASYVNLFKIHVMFHDFPIIIILLRRNEANWQKGSIVIIGCGFISDFC